MSSKACGEIQKDIPRTFPDVPGFDDSAGQRRLMRILRSYCALDPEVGYCQGMNFVAGLLLRYLPCEANAFAAFCVLMRDRNYRELFHPSMAHLKARMAQLEAKLPAAVASRLRRCQIPPELYAPAVEGGPSAPVHIDLRRKSENARGSDAASSSFPPSAYPLRRARSVVPLSLPPRLALAVICPDSLEEMLSSSRRDAAGRLEHT